MSVYNSEEFLVESITSILHQNYQNFELIIIDDGSTDNSKEIIGSFDDRRIINIFNIKNMGLAASLNRALEIATGKYIARMDADDLCMKNRLTVQVNFLEKRKDVDICGGFVSRINTIGKTFKRISTVPIRNKCIKACGIFSPQLFHPTVVFRTSFVEKNKVRYNESFKKTQDFELWSSLIFESDVRFANIPKVLIKYRDIENKDEKRKRNIEQIELANKIRIINLNRLGISCSYSYDILNKFVANSKLSKFDFFRLIILLREVNEKSQNKFNNYPKLNNLFPLHLVKETGLILFFNQKLYRNLKFFKMMKQILFALIRKSF